MEYRSVFTVAQLAKRWRFTRGRVESLADAGLLRAIEFPACGGYGRARRFTDEEVERFERENLRAEVTVRVSAVSPELEALARRMGVR